MIFFNRKKQNKKPKSEDLVEKIRKENEKARQKMTTVQTLLETGSITFKIYKATGH